MKDLTQGSISRHLLHIGFFSGMGTLMQSLYYLVDLYFVAGLGSEVLAGVSIAGNVSFIVMALTLVLGVGTVVLIAHAVGRKDRDAANLIFNQSLSIAGLCTTGTLIAGYALGGVYMRTVSADAEVAAAGESYLYWFLPGLALQFVMVTMGSALRGTGVVWPATISQAASLVLNVVLAPVLIAGWGTGYSLGAAGAGIASSISIALGVGLLGAYFARREKYVFLKLPLLKPDFRTWLRMLNVGVPAGGEFAAIFFIHSVIFWCIQPFGPAAQAGYGAGARILQSIFAPATAVALAAAPVAGQNFGAKQADRVRETLRSASILSSIVMGILTILCQWDPELLIRGFVSDPQTVSIGADYLRIMSWNFVGIGLVFTCSGLFRAIGNTWPALATSAGRALIFAAIAVWLSARPQSRLEYFWYLSVVTITIQAIFSLWLLDREFHRRLNFVSSSPSAPFKQVDLARRSS